MTACINTEPLPPLPNGGISSDRNSCFLATDWGLGEKGSSLSSPQHDAKKSWSSQQEANAQGGAAENVVRPFEPGDGDQ